MKQAFLAILIVLSTPCFASLESNQPQLNLQTTDRRTAYRIGERIPLELSFTGPDKEFEITLSTYDRSGRMNDEQFEIDPASGWADTLATYFGSSRGTMMGGLRGQAVLSEKPTVMHLDMNEWVRFDRPGTYKIVVVSKRVRDVSPTRPHSLREPNLALRSNPIQLKIIPATEAWQQNRLAAILATLKTEPATSGIQATERTAAIADLRFLGTAAAARVMAAHLREDDPDMLYQCTFGLVGLPDKLHPAAVAALNKLIADPSFPISGWFLITMPVLQLTTATFESQREEREQLHDADWELVLHALPSKEGKARAATVQTLLNAQPAKLTPPMKTELGNILASSFKNLSLDSQVMELRFNWDLLQSSTLLPTLQELAKTPLANPESNESPIETKRDLKSIALQRWLEIDPESAHQEILRQIGSSRPSITAEALWFLPKEQLPQFEGIWAEAFQATGRSMFLALMARFGTGTAVPLIQELGQQNVGRWDCATQDAALGYLVQFDPTSARPLLERALKERAEGKTKCYWEMFQDIARFATDPVLTEVAVEALEDSDPRVTMDALNYLMDHGDKSVQQPIWNRYVEWHEKWQGREDVLESRQAGSLGNSEQIGLGLNLARALIASQGWLASDESISRVMDMCVGDYMREQTKQIVDQAHLKPYLVDAFQSGQTENYNVAQYSAKSLNLLEDKVAQFPRGTRFLLGETSPQTEDQKQLEDRVKDLFAKKGMVLERQTNADLRLTQ